jgi:hypothetical protein
MPKVLTDGKISIGAYMFPDRKRPCLCISEGNQSVVYGYFHNIESADEFMDKLADLVRAEKEGADNG